MYCVSGFIIPLLVLIICVSTCLGTKLCVMYFPSQRRLTLFTPAWQLAPVHVLVNNSHWPSAPMTFTCYELIMTSSVACLINLCETQNAKDYYDGCCLCCYIATLWISVLCSFFDGWCGHFFCSALSQIIYIQPVTKAVLMGKDVKAVVELLGNN